MLDITNPGCLPIFQAAKCTGRLKLAVQSVSALPVADRATNWQEALVWITTLRALNHEKWLDSEANRQLIDEFEASFNNLVHGQSPALAKSLHVGPDCCVVRGSQFERIDLVNAGSIAYCPACTYQCLAPLAQLEDSMGVNLI